MKSFQMKWIWILGLVVGLGCGDDDANPGDNANTNNASSSNSTSTNNSETTNVEPGNNLNNVSENNSTNNTTNNTSTNNTSTNNTSTNNTSTNNTSTNNTSTNNEDRGISCMEILQCLLVCTSEDKACQAECSSQGTEKSQSEIKAFLGCVDFHCEDAITVTTLTECTLAHCSEEQDTCLDM